MSSSPRNDPLVDQTLWLVGAAALVCLVGGLLLATNAWLTSGLATGRKGVYLALLERLGTIREEQLPRPVGRSARASGGGHGVSLAGLDRGEPDDLSRHDRTP